MICKKKFHNSFDKKPILQKKQRYSIQASRLSEMFNFEKNMDA